MIEIKEVSGKKQLKDFVMFPYELYKNDSYYVPPIIKDEYHILQPELNPAFAFCDARFWVVYKNGKVAGRIGAIINRKYNEKIGKVKGRFSRLEFIDDPDVSALLLETAEKWLRDKGCTEIHGPLGFTNLDTQGMLIEGFDHLPSIASVYHKPYYKKHVEALGFEKENDWIEFRLTVGEQAQKKAKRGAQLIARRYGFEIVKPQSKDELRSFVKPMFKILNEAFTELPYVSPFTEELITLYSEKYIKVMDPKFVRIIKKDDRIIAFLISVPSLSEAMQKAKGKLFPFGFIHVLRALRKPKVLDLMLTGVIPEFQNAGAAVLLFAEIQEQILSMGFDQMETTGIFETNHNVISNWKNYPHIQHKRRRCFVKSLNQTTS